MDRAYLRGSLAEQRGLDGCTGPDLPEHGKINRLSHNHSLHAFQPKGLALYSLLLSNDQCDFTFYHNMDQANLRVCFAEQRGHDGCTGPD